MDRDEFITTVYCLVCAHYQKIKSTVPLRRGGFALALTDEEGITMEICGESFKLHTDKDLFAYFRAHYAHFFPRLTERTLFVRQAANLWQVKAALQQQLTHVSGQAADPVQSIDTLPLPVCGYTRSGRDRCFKPFALRALGRQEAGLRWLQTGPADCPLRDDHRLSLVAGPTA